VFRNVSNAVCQPSGIVTIATSPLVVVNVMALFILHLL
jgi:hypothetical protein